MKNTIILLLVFLSVPSWSQEFSLANEATGINHVFKHNGFTGGGAVFFDCNNDGFDDLYITSGLDIDQFYINNGDGTFSENGINAGFGLTATYYTTAAFSGDINNDGLADLFITTRGDAYTLFTKNFLYLNLGDESFVDIWPHDSNLDAAYSMGATFIDYNLDGLLDVYVSNYVEQNGFLLSDEGEIIGYDHNCFENQLYQNMGNLIFERIDLAVNDKGCCLSAVASDLDNDDDLDLLIANDFGEFVEVNTSYQNLYPQDAFANTGAEIGVNQAIYGMGIAAADYDNDQDIDYYITNFGPNILLENNDGNFVDVAQIRGCDDAWNYTPDRTAIGWGCFFADLDNDGYQDLYVANGYVPSPDFQNSTYGQPDKLYRNIKGESFEEISFQAGIENINESRGAIYSDYDNDGDLDIFVVVENIPIFGDGWSSKFYRNDSPSKSYLQIQLKGNRINSDAFGTKVWLYCQDKIYLQEKLSSSSHASQNTGILHFGLDTISNIDSIIVDWPGLLMNDTIYNTPANQRIIIEENFTILDSMMVDTMTIDTMIIDTMVVDTMIIDNIEPELSYHGISLIPNPCTDFIELSSDKLFKFEFQIISITGQVIKSGFSDSNQSINVSNLSTGIYLFRTRNGSNVLILQFLKI